MILSEYEAKRGELEKEMEKLNAMESEKKMELSVKHQTELKKNCVANRAAEKEACRRAEPVPKR